MAYHDWPTPLKPKETLQLMKDYKAGDGEAKEKIAEGNMRLVAYCARKFENTGVDVDELIGVGMIGLIKSIETFNPEKLFQFATYASRCINNEILMFLRKNKKHKNNASLEDVLTTDIDGKELTLAEIMPDKSIAHFSETFVYEDNMEEITSAISTLPEKHQRILYLRYLENKTQRDVSKYLNISQSYVSRLETALLKRVKVAIKNREIKFEEQYLLRRKEEEKMTKTRNRMGQGDRAKAIQLLKDTTMSYKEVSDLTGVPLSTTARLGLEHRAAEVREELHRKAREERGQYLRELAEEKKKKSAIKQVEIETSTRKQEEEKMVESGAAEQTSEGTIVRSFTFKYSGSGKRIHTKRFQEEMESILSTLKDSGNEYVNFDIVISAE